MYKSRIRNAKQRGKQEKSREIEFPDDGQTFAVVERMLGNGRVEVYSEDTKLRTVRIRGSMRKYKSKVIIECSDLVLVSLWDFETDKGDLIHKYTHDEKNYMMYHQMLPENIHRKLNKVAGGVGYQDEETDEHIVFGDEIHHGSSNSKLGSSSSPPINHSGPDEFNIDDI
jgi:translation initiation factor 1A